MGFVPPTKLVDFSLPVANRMEGLWQTARAVKQLSCSVTPEKKGTFFWARPCIVGQPPKKKVGTQIGATELRPNPSETLAMILARMDMGETRVACVTPGHGHVTPGY